MSLKEDITKARIKALKEQDTVTKTSVGYILSAIKQFEVDRKKEVTDADVISIVKTLVRQRKDAIEEYSTIQELVDRDSAEIAVLVQYLPVQLSDEDVIVIIRNGINEAKSEKVNIGFGDVMKIVKNQLNGKTDMSKLKAIIEKELG